MFRPYLPSILALAALCTTGCSMLTPKQDTQAQTAKWLGNSQWRYGETLAAAKKIEQDWWQAFSSPQLNQFIASAQTQNSDVLIAAERVRQAELQLNIAKASLFPSLGLSASSGERRNKEEGGNWQRSESSSVGLTANYEIDLWGGIAAERKIAGLDYRASEYTLEATRLSTNADIAATWFNYLATQERLVSAQRNIDIAQRLQKIVESRYRNGVATAADVAQQKTNLLAQQTALLPLQLESHQTQAALSLLIGQTPQSFTPAIESFDQLQIPTIEIGLPADVLARRPDIAISEANLDAAAASVAQARAALLPGLQISANAGKSADALFSLNPAAQSTGWSLSLAQTLFDRGRLKNQVKLSQSRRVELLETFRQTTLTALNEVDGALDSASSTRQQEINQRDVVEQARRSLQLNEAAYREGAADLQALLNSQRSLFQAQDALVQIRLARLKAAVDLYKALGGGWQPKA